MLDDLGLIPTLRWYIQNFSNRLGISSSFETIGLEEKLSPQIETAFYRIVQEALNNIAKHAQADRVEISLVKRDSKIFASIQDNGKGFDLGKVLHPESPERSFGIVGIQERVSLLGGQMEIQSRPGFGTLIAIEIPYEGVRDGDEKDTSSIGGGSHHCPSGDRCSPRG
jgi:signal transduction histidine kinase